MKSLGLALFGLLLGGCVFLQATDSQSYIKDLGNGNAVVGANFGTTLIIASSQGITGFDPAHCAYPKKVDFKTKVVHCDAPGEYTIHTLGVITLRVTYTPREK